MITFNVVKEQHGWAIRMGERMMTPFWSRDLAVREANCLAAAIRCHGECAEVIVEGADPSEPRKKVKGSSSSRLEALLRGRWAAGHSDFRPVEGAVRRCLSRQMTSRAGCRSSHKGALLTPLRRLLGVTGRHPPWDDGAPIRAELFSVERLEEHARSLAAAQGVMAGEREGRLTGEEACRKRGGVACGLSRCRRRPSTRARPSPPRPSG